MKLLARHLLAAVHCPSHWMCVWWVESCVTCESFCWCLSLYVDVWWCPSFASLWYVVHVKLHVLIVTVTAVMMLMTCDVGRDLQVCFSCWRSWRHLMTSARRRLCPSSLCRVATAQTTFSSCDIWRPRSYSTSTRKVVLTTSRAARQHSSFELGWAALRGREELCKCNVSQWELKIKHRLK